MCVCVCVCVVILTGISGSCLLEKFGLCSVVTASLLVGSPLVCVEGFPTESEVGAFPTIAGLCCNTGGVFPTGEGIFTSVGPVVLVES